VPMIQIRRPFARRFAVGGKTRGTEGMFVRSGSGVLAEDVMLLNLQKQ
jgi:hypothetical protein